MPNLATRACYTQWEELGFFLKRSEKKAHRRTLCITSICAKNLLLPPSSIDSYQKKYDIKKKNEESLMTQCLPPLKLKEEKTLRSEFKGELTISGAPARTRCRPSRSSSVPEFESIYLGILNLLHGHEHSAPTSALTSREGACMGLPHA